ncbi:MAG: amidase domain-containing protein, partial [Clostridiales bacterium]|nr:amidase domain-containing protein [Clostridiales bacterium]
MAYQRDLAVAYAHEWALKRNPRYLDFNGIGGDCTNFISQCLYAGGAPMNYQKLNGWYYNSASDRAPAWTGVDYFYSFLMRNQSIGPYAAEAAPEELEPGDVIQLSFDAQRYAHTLLIVDILGT